LSMDLESFFARDGRYDLELRPVQEALVSFMESDDGIDEQDFFHGSVLYRYIMGIVKRECVK
jgi:hypothetical protein